MAFSSWTKAQDIVDKYGADVKGKTVVISGANSGIGEETARVLAGAGARVVLCSRSLENGNAAADRIKKQFPNASLRVAQLDLADLKSVDAFSKEFLKGEKGPDLLILNAGVMACPLERTAQGFEMQTGTNHIGHFRLTENLLGSMKKGNVPRRVVAVSSAAHAFPGLDVDDLNWEKRAYSAWGSYGQSKLANVLFIKELAARLEGTQISAFSLHPGVIKTNLQRHMGSFFGLRSAIEFLTTPLLKSIPQGAATTVFGALSPEITAQSGAYLQNCQVAKPSARGRDLELAKKLWAKTETMIRNAGFAAPTI